MSAFALHYVFYVEYCKELKNFYYFLDGHVLGLDKRMSKPPVVVQKKLNILEQSCCLLDLGNIFLFLLLYFGLFLGLVYFVLFYV